LDNLYFTGSFNYTADFDPGPETFYLSTGGISWEIFVLKLSDIVTSVTDRNYSSAISIYPNPSSGNFTIETGERGQSHYIIYDALYRSVLSGKSSGDKITIDLSAQPNGQYFLLLNTQLFKLMKLD